MLALEIVFEELQQLFELFKLIFVIDQGDIDKLLVLAY